MTRRRRSDCSARTPSGFACYSGDDLMTLPLLSVGAVGLIGVATHWCGVECGEMIRRFRGGDHAGSLEIARALIPSFVYETGDDAPNPVPLKAVLRVLGLPAGECRSPMGPTPAGLEDRARAVFADLDAGATPGAAMAEDVRLVFLGGLGEIGRNCAAIEHDGRVIIVDCGVMFPDPEMPGVDLVLPDFTYLKEIAGRIEGIVLTHGHEDHVGGLGFLLRDIETKVYGSPLSLGLARSRPEDSGSAGRSELIAVADGERRRIGPFDVEFIPVTHSVPQGFAVAFHTAPGGRPALGGLQARPHARRRPPTDLARIGALADSEGIRLLLSDSTNAEEPGFTRSERTVGETLRQIFVEHPEHRVIVACFASHIHRIQQLG